jgi:alpha-1,4-glucan:alpha-1,4-glucan 6-glycosyltransferase
MIDDELRAAVEGGIEVSFVDVRGRRHDADGETVRWVLELLGDEEPDGPPPVLVLRDGSPPNLDVPGATSGTLVLESGGEVDLVPDPDREDRFRPGGPVPHGYHRALFPGLGESLVISAPARCFEGDGRRETTLFVPLHAIRTARDPGAGDLTDLARLCRFARDRGLSTVALLPLDAAFLDPAEPSPYSPVSRLFWNELFVDPAAAEELSKSPIARRVLGSADFARETAALRAFDHYDPDRLWALKRRVLGPLARAAREDALAEYVAARPEVQDYARFRARGDEAEARLWLYAQRLAEVQVAAAARAGARLSFDLPLGAGGDSYDVWRHPELFAVGLAAGAPPDDLCAGGQNWGFPPLKPRAMRRDGYRYLRACLAHHMAHAASLRIDHVMQFHRLFVIPDGMPAGKGVYLRYPADELHAVLALESHRHRCRVTGENLGTVPPEVTERLRTEGIRGMWVLPFELRSGAPKPVPPGVQASLDTHDTPPFAAFAKSLPPEDQRRLRVNVADDDLLAGALRFAAESPAGEVVVSLSDLCREERPQNVPGTGPGMRNFRRRMARTLEEIEADPEVTRLIEVATDPGATPAPPRVLEETLLTPDDLWRFAEGTHSGLGEVMGAHPGTAGGREGTFFAVWAPNAERVSVIGDFNGWTPRRHGLHPQGSSGIFAGFIPGVIEGDIYKYHLVSRVDGYTVEKADPFALFAELPPRTASVVTKLDHEWGDAEWMASRRDRIALDAPVSVYEVHLGSFRRVPEEGNRWLTWREMAPVLAAYVKENGFTHVELMPIMEHPFYGSWGYQVLGYFAPTSRFGTPEDFMFFVDHLHREGIGVILDWVPSHFPADVHGLSFFDGTHLFEHADPRLGYHPDWGSLIYNYGRNEVRSFLTSAALHWLSRYHADGLRTDAVASMLYLDYSRKPGQWIPNRDGGRENLGAIEFLKRMNEECYARFPGIQTIAEESTAWPGVSRPTFAGGLGFGLKWDMGWMHDTLAYMAREPIHRRYHQGEITFRAIYAFTENYQLSLSHDEVVHGKRSLLERMPGDDWQKFANLRLLYAYMWAQSGKKLLFMGCEFAQRREWNFEESLDWHLLGFEPHARMQRLVRELNRQYREEPALHELDCDPAGFEWIRHDDADSSVLSFLRKPRGPARCVLGVFHFTPLVREGYRVGVPHGGLWRVVLNTDDAAWGGSGAGTTGEIAAEDVPFDGRPRSLALTLPPLGALWLVPAEGPA